MKRYESYKKVDMPWLKEVPSGWKVVRLGNYSKFKTGGTPPNNKGISQIGEIPWVTAEDLEHSKLIYNSKKKISKEILKEMNYNLFPPKSILYTCIASIGKIGIAQVPMYSNQQITAIMLNNINERYVFYFLIAIEDLIKNYAAKNVVPNINTTYLKNIRVLFPPLQEQEQIAKFLDLKISEIDKLIELEKSKIEKLEELKRAKATTLIYKTVDKSKKEIMLSQCSSEQFISNKKVQHQNLLSLSYGDIIRRSIDTTSGLLPQSFDTYQVVNKGNIILRLTDLQNDKRSLRVGLVKEDGIITSAYVCLKGNSYIIPEYLYLHLHAFDLKKGFYGMGAGVRQSLSFKEIKKLPIYIYSLNKQKEIIEKYNQCCMKIDLLKEKTNQQITYLEELKQTLISDAVTGKIDIRDIKIPER